MNREDIQSVSEDGMVTFQPPTPEPIVTSIADLTAARDEAQTEVERATNQVAKDQQELAMSQETLAKLTDVLAEKQTLIDAATQLHEAAVLAANQSLA